MFIKKIFLAGVVLFGIAQAKVIVSIEGNTGAGKTTLTSLLREQWKDAFVVSEPFDAWQSINGGENLFKKFVEDKQRWAFTYQTWAYCTNLFPFTHENNHEITITDRSLHAGQNCFVKMQYREGNLSKLEYDLYNQQANMLRSLLPHKLSGIIYLRTTPQIAQQRTNKRDRDLKDGVELSWFELLHRVHEEWLIEKKDIPDDTKNIPVLVIDGDVDFQHNSFELNKIMAQVRAFIEGMQKQPHVTTMSPVEQTVGNAQGCTVA